MCRHVASRASVVYHCKHGQDSILSASVRSTRHEFSPKRSARPRRRHTRTHLHKRSPWVRSRTTETRKRFTSPRRLPSAWDSVSSPAGLGRCGTGRRGRRSRRSTRRSKRRRERARDGRVSPRGDDDRERGVAASISSPRRGDALAMKEDAKRSARAGTSSTPSPTRGGGIDHSFPSRLAANDPARVARSRSMSGARANSRCPKCRYIPGRLSGGTRARRRATPFWRAHCRRPPRDPSRSSLRKTRAPRPFRGQTPPRGRAKARAGKQSHFAYSARSLARARVRLVSPPRARPDERSPPTKHSLRGRIHSERRRTTTTRRLGWTRCGGRERTPRRGTRTRGERVV